MKTVIQELIDDLIKGNVKPDGHYLEKEKEQTIRFSEWVNKIRTYNSKIYCINSYEELLEIYKKQKE